MGVVIWPNLPTGEFLFPVAMKYGNSELDEA